MKDSSTIRGKLHQILKPGPASALQLSKLLGLPEREVVDHLSHLERSLPHGGERLVIEPPQCLACGFTFTDRRRLSKPGSCPRCRHPRITRPLFSVAAGKV